MSNEEVKLSDDVQSLESDAITSTHTEDAVSDDLNIDTDTEASVEDFEDSDATKDNHEDIDLSDDALATEDTVDAIDTPSVKKRPGLITSKTEDIDLFSGYSYREKEWWNKYKIVMVAVAFLFVVTTIILLVILGKWHLTGRYTDNLGEQIREEVTTIITTTTATSPPVIVGFDGEVIEEVELPVNVVPAEEKYDALEVDFTELREKYSNAVGWVKVPGIDLEYPVAQTTNNDYYLNHSIDGTLSKAGWVFLDYRLTTLRAPSNLIVYGHNMADGTIFGKLKHVMYEDWWSNPDNQYIYFTTENYTAVYQVYTVFQVKSTEVNYARRDLNTSNMLDYLNEMSGYNIMDNLTYASPFRATDKVITLSTCADAQGTEKFVVQGILVYERNLNTSDNVIVIE